MNISEFVAGRYDEDEEASEDREEEKEPESEEEKKEKFFAEKKAERKRKKKLRKDGMDLFFRKDNYIQASPDEYDGHYPGNQNNTIMIPYKRAVKHVS